MYKRIMLPLGGSSLAESALPHTVAQAERFGAELVLMRFIAPLPVPPMATPGALQMAEEETMKFARKYLKRVTADVQERGIRVQIAATMRRPHLQITEYAEANQVDLIVMCTRGQSGLSRWLMGTVADRVARGAKVPVLLVRAMKEKQ